MSTFNYNKYERMTRNEKDRYCDDNDVIIQEMVHARYGCEENIEERRRGKDCIEKEHMKNKFKRQFTATSIFEDHNMYDTDDNNPFTFISRGAKRKPKRQQENINNSYTDDVIIDTDHATSATTTARNGGRLIINSNSRMTRKDDIINPDIQYTKRYQYAKKIDKNINKEKDVLSNNENTTRYTPHPNKTNRNEDHRFEELNDRNKNEKIQISKHALHYAVEHHLPTLLIGCQPKINNQDKAKEIIKFLLNYIEKNFRKINKNYEHPIGFEYWYINKNGDLTCYTRHIELFVYLSDHNNYPTTISDIVITPFKPKHLPSQHSIILKFVPVHISQEDIINELQQHLQSLHNIEDMKGSKNEKFRHVRIELKSKNEYEQILKNGGITIDGQLIEAHEFLAPPRLLICTKCNEPGHSKRNCTAPFDVCRRCGKDRSIGEHKECIISCHRCQQQHLSTDYKCEYLTSYRRSLLNRLKEKPSLLPPNVRFFIPAECRD